MVTDPVSDMIIRLQNAALAKKKAAVVPHSEFKLAIAEGLKRAGFVSSIVKKGKKIKKFLEVELVYDASGAPKLGKIRRISRSARRVYHPVSEIRRVRQGTGVAIYSTPAGVLTDREAKKARVGGEVLFEVW